MSENLKTYYPICKGATDQETLLKYLNNQLSDVQEHGEKTTALGFFLIMRGAGRLAGNKDRKVLR